MRRFCALAAVLLLGACGGGSSGGDDAHAPAAAPTLPPGGAFKDALLYAAVKARLAGSDIDAATGISVRVHGGVVTLSGVVKDAATKAREVKLVGSMRGIKGVNDALHVGRVGPGALQTLRNAALVAAVETEPAARAGVRVGRVNVSVDAGGVPFAGEASPPVLMGTLDPARQSRNGRNAVDTIVVR